MFQFSGFALPILYIQIGVTIKDSRVSPFGNPRVKACLSARRGLSQISTSFIAYYRLGIHHMRLFTWPYNPKQPHLSPYKQGTIKKVVAFVTLITWADYMSRWYMINNITLNADTRTQRYFRNNDISTLFLLYYRFKFLKNIVTW